MLETYVIYVSNECNCACKYCYLQNGTKIKEYSWQDIKAYLDDIVKTNKLFNIEFLGGEPMLRPDLIENTVMYLENLDNVTVNGYTITTNGTILTNNIINLLRTNNKVRWAASMDGTKVMNQLRLTKSGKNTYDLVFENIATLWRHQIGDDQISIHMVTHPYNIYLLEKGIEHLYKKGIRNIGVGTVESTIIIGEEYCNLYISELDKVSNRIINGDLVGLHIDVLDGLKPKSDVRHYVKDENGAVIGETYGRAGDDVTKNKNYNVSQGSSPIGNIIYNIREIVYKNHQRRKRL